MAHKALVAYERPDGRYNLHFSHEGAHDLRLASAITPDTPFGGPIPSSDQRQRLELMLQCEPGGTNISVDSARYRSAPVGMEPVAIALTMEEICQDHLDYLLHGALFVVDRAYTVTAYRTFALSISDGRETEEPADTVGDGVLFPIRWNDEEPVADGVLRGRSRALKDVTSDMLDKGVFDETTTRRER